MCGCTVYWSLIQTSIDLKEQHKRNFVFRNHAWLLYKPWAVSHWQSHEQYKYKSIQNAFISLHGALMSLPRACACAAGVECLVCLLFVHHFLGCLCVMGIFKVSIYTWQVDLLIKVARRRSAIERDVLEARKTLVKLKHRYGPPFLVRSAIRTCKRHGRMRTLSSNCMDWYGRMRTLTRRVHPWKCKYGL